MTHGPLSWRELVERDKQKSEDARGQIKRAAMPVQADPVAWMYAKAIAADALLAACEGEPADPDHPNTISITTDDFETVVRCAVENWLETHPPAQWQGIESAPRDGTKAILYFPQYATDFDGVDYSYSLAIYRKNSTFPLGTWCDQGTNHDSFEGPDMTGCDKASHWMPLPTPPAGGSDAE